MYETIAELKVIRPDFKYDLGVRFFYGTVEVEDGTGYPLYLATVEIEGESIWVGDIVRIEDDGERVDIFNKEAEEVEQLIKQQI
jgi:hypothetical protein